MGVRGCINATILVDLLQKGVVGGSGRRISTPVKEQSSIYFWTMRHGRDDNIAVFARLLKFKVNRHKTLALVTLTVEDKTMRAFLRLLAIHLIEILKDMVDVIHHTISFLFHLVGMLFN